MSYSGTCDLCGAPRSAPGRWLRMDGDGNYIDLCEPCVRQVRSAIDDLLVDTCRVCKQRIEVRVPIYQTPNRERDICDACWLNAGKLASVII